MQFRTVTSCVLLLLYLVAGAKAETSETTMMLESSLLDKYDSTNLVWSKAARGTLECLNECSQDPVCESFFFNSLTGDCSAMDVTMTTVPATAVSQTGSKYYRGNPPQVPEVCPQTYTWEPSVQLCYRISTDSLGWGAAQDQCVTDGGHLYHAKVAETHTFMKGLLSGSGSIYFIGARIDLADGTFSWTDGTLMDYAPWGVGEPNNVNKKVCVVLNPADSYDMNDRLCTATNKYICQI